jgi:hypothetical protein
MKKAATVICLCMVLCSGCRIIEGTSREQVGTNMAQATSREGVNIDKEKAITIAREDAVKAYGSVEAFNVFACETARSWHVIFELKDADLNGGAPEYIIDKKTGNILRKTYEQ